MAKRHYKYIFRDFRETIHSCPVCGRFAGKNDDWCETVRKTTIYFHRRCLWHRDTR